MSGEEDTIGRIGTFVDNFYIRNLFGVFVFLLYLLQLFLSFGNTAASLFPCTKYCLQKPIGFKLKIILKNKMKIKNNWFLRLLFFFFLFQNFTHRSVNRQIENRISALI